MYNIKDSGKHFSKLCRLLKPQLGGIVPKRFYPEGRNDFNFSFHFLFQVR